MIRVAGLDIGFSRSRPSSGVATLADGQLTLRRCMSGDAAIAPIRDTGPYEVIAIDGPIVSDGADPWTRRGVERLFASGPFQRRCKPAASHVVGTGRQLREAACVAANALASVASRSVGGATFPLVRSGTIVETFPNTFLGVCLGDQIYRDMPPLKRGRKFDWLYEQWNQSALIEKFSLPEGADILPHSFRITENHDERAALVCLLAALLVAQGSFIAVGDEEDGWFFLPPRQVWQPWAYDALNAQVKRLREEGSRLRIAVSLS